jgi:hypothetical protein
VDGRATDAERVADAYAADLILPPFMIEPRLLEVGQISFGAIRDLAQLFSASLTATALRVVKTTRQPLILVAHNLAGRKWQWPSGTGGQIRVRDDIDPRSSAYMPIAKAGRPGAERKEPAHYWFDRRHIEQFDVKVQTIETLEGERLTLIGIPDPRLIEIYG